MVRRAGTRSTSGAAPTAMPGTPVAPVTIIRWAHGGDGVGYADGKVMFVRDVVPGDVVEVAVTESHARWARGVVTRIATPSSERVPVPCPLQSACGGCPWMIGSAAAQAASRQAILEGEVRKKLGAEVPVVMAPSGPELAYRTRVRLTYRDGRVGYIGYGSHTFVPIEACAVADARINAALDGLRSHLARRGGSGRVTLLAGEDGVAGWIEPEPGAGEVYLKESVVMAFGAYRQTLAAAAFAQANAAVTGALLAELTQIFRDAGPGHAVELFAGSGTLTQALWATGWSVSAYEIDVAARARFATTRVAMGGIGTWHASDLATGLVHPTPPRPDAILLDPPRTGAKAVIPWIRASAARFVVYVSCDLATAMSDLALLSADGRWRVTRVTGWDMVPHTGHQEIVAVARRAM